MIVVNIVVVKNAARKNVHKRVLHGLMNVGRNRTLDLVVLLFVESVVNFMVFDNALIQGTALYGSCHACGKGVDECVIQMVVMVVSVRLGHAKGVLKQQQQKLSKKIIMKREDF